MGSVLSAIREDKKKKKKVYKKKTSKRFTRSIAKGKKKLNIFGSFK